MRGARRFDSIGKHIGEEGPGARRRIRGFVQTINWCRGERLSCNRAVNRHPLLNHGGSEEATVPRFDKPSDAHQPQPEFTNLRS